VSLGQYYLGVKKKLMDALHMLHAAEIMSTDDFRMYKQRIKNLISVVLHKNKRGG